jgi:hypothetical protein
MKKRPTKLLLRGAQLAAVWLVIVLLTICLSESVESRRQLQEEETEAEYQARVEEFLTK